ncbi:MAG: portal protein [Paracoccaceae bacterium]
MTLNTDAKSLKENGDNLFSKKRAIDTRNQELAENFYPERADFTSVRSESADWAGHLMTGYPSLTRRDLGNALGSILRPRNLTWFHPTVEEEDRVDHVGKQWLEWAGGLQRRAMYDRISQFTRATKEGDHDFATFGGAVLSVEMNWRDTALLYRSWHLRDVAWAEDAYCMIDQVHRNWKPTARQLHDQFKGNVHECVTKCLEKESFKTINCRHIKVPSYLFSDKYRQPWVSVHIDLDNDFMMLDEPAMSRGYVIPRWMTISGSQYPYSPAALIALPDARLIQAMSMTLLQAGERYVDPPMIGVSEAIKGNVELFAGGFTAIDSEYDERLGEVLRPLTQDKSGLPYGFEMQDRTAALLRDAFYLNDLALPPSSVEMTAFETGQRVQEYIRRAMPLFEPMEHEYNGQLCEETFDTLMLGGAFGSRDMIPESVQSQGKIKWKFESPIAEAAERQKGQLFLESKAMISAAMEVDPGAAHLVDFGATLRDVLNGIGAPALWLRSEDDVNKAKQADQKAQETAALLQQGQQGADIAAKLGSASSAFAQEQPLI